MTLADISRFSGLLNWHSTVSFRHGVEELQSLMKQVLGMTPPEDAPEPIVGLVKRSWTYTALLALAAPVLLAALGAGGWVPRGDLLSLIGR